VRFWDSSALVPLIVDQAHSSQAEGLVRTDPGIVVWWGSALECLSALSRLRREGLLDPQGEDVALDLLYALAESWSEISPRRELRTNAERLVRIHPLRAADSLQLAAGLDWAISAGDSEFVTFDWQLARAARLEGFRVLEAD